MPTEEGCVKTEPRPECYSHKPESARSYQTGQGKGEDFSGAFGEGMAHLIPGFWASWPWGCEENKFLLFQVTQFVVI